MDKVKKHFKAVDPILYSTIREEFSLTLVDDPKNYFQNLCRSIIHQQLSTKVGEVIFQRFNNLFNKTLTPEKVLKAPDEKIRTIGISYTKIKYIKDLAQKIIDKQIVLADLPNLKDMEVIEILTQVKGIGVWTSEMFLMSSLGREDIFSHGDFGLKRAIEKLYKLENPSMEIVEEISLKWSPYRTYASRILWNSLKT